MYTYDDFEKAVRDAGLYDQFSSADLNLAKINPDAGMSLLGFKRDYSTATTADQRALANAGAEKVRGAFGNYEGGTTGSGFQLNPTTPSSYEAKEYESPYKSQIADKLAGLQNRSFSYDPSTDVSTQSYQKAFAREGERASRNAMGQAASMTGGIPSTFAVTAGAQAGQYYASQMADKTAELEQQAYNRFMQEKTIDMQILEALSGLDNAEYSRFSDSQNFNYAQLLNQIENNQTTKAESDAAFEQRAQNYATAGDYSLLQQLGYSDDVIARLKQKAKGSGTAGTAVTADTDPDPSSTGISLADVSATVNAWLSQGATLGEIQAQLESQAASMDPDEYNKYATILAAKAEDAARGSRK